MEHDCRPEQLWFAIHLCLKCFFFIYVRENEAKNKNHSFLDLQSAGKDRYVHASLDVSVYFCSTSKQKSEQGGHFSSTKVTFPNAGKRFPGPARALFTEAKGRVRRRCICAGLIITHGTHTHTLPQPSQENLEKREAASSHFDPFRIFLGKDWSICIIYPWGAL